MKILLAPAETKIDGGVATPLELKSFQKPVIEAYEEYISQASIEELSKWFGLKKLPEVEKYKTTIQDKPTLKAIQRYTGVAFEAIAYNRLEKSSQEYLDKNLFIFSNLFGVVEAGDFIPNYKFKQGAVLPNFDNIAYFKKEIKLYLDDILQDEQIVDLRAGFYDKLYKPKSETITYKFLKDGKVVSHWAKHYRGVVLRAIANHKVSNFQELLELELENLSLVEIQEKKNIKTLIMQIK